MEGVPVVQESKRSKILKLISKILDSQFGISLLSIIISLFMLAIMAMIYKANPIQVIVTLLQGALKGKRAITFTLMQMAPLIMTALAVYIPSRARFFNVGAQGQLEIAGLVAMIVSTTVKGSPIFVITLAMLAAMVAGMITVIVPLVLKIKGGASEITTTIMMNFICTNFVYALITGPLKDPDAFYAASHGVPEQYKLLSIPAGSDINIGIYLSVFIALIVGWYMKNTVVGMKLKATGMNMNAARVAGINVNRMMIGATFAGAACAGFAGGMVLLGVTYRIAEGWALAWGTTGVAVAHLGGSPLGIIPVAFVLAIIETGARYMQAITGVPSAMVMVMQGAPVVVFICLVGIKQLYKMKKVG
ncbi:MAG: ABC transporter permease [Christensenellales bacterium]|jgi:ABC-type uncharacterized transport system permease subunit